MLSISISNHDIAQKIRNKCILLSTSTNNSYSLFRIHKDAKRRIVSPDNIPKDKRVIKESIAFPHKSIINPLF